MLSAADQPERLAEPLEPMRVEKDPPRGNDRGLRVYGDLRLRDAGALWKVLMVNRPARGQELRVDLSGVKSVDGSVVALLTAFRFEQRESGARCELASANDTIEELIHLYQGNDRLRRARRRRPQGLLDQMGAATLRILLEGQLVIAFFGQMVMGALNVVRSPRSMNWKEVTPLMERAGADAVPIVMLINFLVGAVIGLQSAGQLKRFGADIFMADLVGISVVREIGPLMTAIVICGRSGAAYAAELGSMKTNEEVDALRTMGFGPMRFLVMPRALALMAVMPLLTLTADLSGGVGGLVVGIKRLGLISSAYINETQRAVHMHDLLSGLIKSVAFGLAIALIACQQGLAATGGAEGVGRRTTSAVVTTLFTLILIDAFFTVFFAASSAL
jgi:phospholipid/cholesterol/gamma-HCH transport system permease protein